MFRKLFSILFSIFICSNTAVVLAEDSTPGYIFQGRAEINDQSKGQDDIFTGDKGKVNQGTTLQMTVSNVISSTYNIEGDEFFAEVTTDVEGPGGVLIPAGTIAHGKVSGVGDSKRLGRDGYVNLSFDYLVTPDGRELPMEGKMTTKMHPAATAGKIILEDAAYTIGGGVVGGIAAIKLFGVGAAISSNGYTVAGGAGVGAVIGAGYALGRKGSEILLSPGDEIKVKIMGAMELPVMSEKAFKQSELHYNGLDVSINNIQLEKDPFGEPNTLTLDLTVINRTNKTFSSFDMALINDYNSIYYASPFGNTEMWFTRIMPNTRIAGKLSFSVDNPKRKHWLVFYDNRTRKPIAKLSLENARRDIKNRTKQQKTKK